MYICIYRDASLSYLLNCSLPTQVIQQQKCERDKKKKKRKRHRSGGIFYYKTNLKRSLIIWVYPFAGHQTAFGNKTKKKKQSPLTHKSQNSTIMKNTEISSLVTIFNIWQYVNIPKVIMLSTVNCVTALMGLLYTTSYFSVKRKGSSMCMCIFIWACAMNSAKWCLY